MPQYLQGFKDGCVKICNNLYENPKVFKKCAVNTIVREKDGSYTGYNTDYDGFVKMIKYANANVKDKKAIIIK